MSYGLTSDEVVQAQIDEMAGKPIPADATPGMRAFRKKLRAEIKEIESKGGIIDIPFEIPDFD
jgi:hypothetical protein